MEKGFDAAEAVGNEFYAVRLPEMCLAKHGLCKLCICTWSLSEKKTVSLYLFLALKNLAS